MSSKIADLKHKRAVLIASARSILDKAEKEKRELNSEEESQYESIWAEQTKLEEQIKREEVIAAAELALETTDPTRNDDPAKTDPKNDPATTTDKRIHPLAQPEYRDAFLEWLTSGNMEIPTSVRDDIRALQMDSGVAGGYLIAPQQFVTELIKKVDDLVFMRPLATTMQITKAESLGVPSLDADPADADWTVELATGSEDTAMALGKREFAPHPVAKRVKVSNTLLRYSPLNVEGLVRERLAYKFGITQEKGFLVGSGAMQPLGVFTASDDGIPTGRDVSTGNTTTEIQFDGLIEAKYTLKSQYWPRARWIFHRDAMKQIAKIKDGEGQYIWRESVRQGEPDRILGFPQLMSEYAPNTFTTGLYVGILGDFSQYWIVDALDLQVQRVIELYAETNETGFIGRAETDGMPVLGEAFVRVTLL